MERNVFAQCRKLVSARAVAERYGFQPNRAGFIRCPFHQRDQDPSLKLYPDGNWKCFGCGRGGSSIDFVMLLFDLELLEAVRRLDADFNLDLFLDKPPPDPAETQHRRQVTDSWQAFEAWRKETIRGLTQCVYLANLVEKNLNLPLSELCYEVLRKREWCDYVLEELLCGPPGKQLDAWRMRRELDEWIKKALSD